jgi:antitoxin (DNA-binding transcriptional repressor) of toxin-antitoxin stability system
VPETVTIHAAKTTLSQLLARVEAGEEPDAELAAWE